MPSYFAEKIAHPDARARHLAERQANLADIQSRQSSHTFQAPSLLSTAKNFGARVVLGAGLGLTGAAGGMIASDQYLGTTLATQFTDNVEALLSSSSLPADTIETPSGQYFTTAPVAPEV